MGLVLVVSNNFENQFLFFFTSYVPIIIVVSDLVNQGISMTKRMHISLYDWIVYKQESKAKEKERRGQAALFRVLYNFCVM